MVIPNLTKSAQHKDTLESLLEDIDKKLYYLSKKEYAKVSFGLDSTVDYNMFEDLLTYRDIITNKVKGCNCYNSFPISLIVSKVKKLVQ